MSLAATDSCNASPYPGLRPFTPTESSVFFGRGEQVGDMLERLENHRFLAVVGASGSGKSSLVRAGLIPAIHEGYLLRTSSDWLTVTFRPGGSPFHNLASAFRSQLPASDRAPAVGCDSSDIAFTEAVLRSGPKGLIEAFQDAKLRETTHLLVVVDQFEEIFRFRNRVQDDTDPEDANKYFDESTALVRLLLASASARDQPIYVVITMRSDFVGNCDAFRGLPAAISDGQFLTPRLSRDS